MSSLIGCTIFGVLGYLIAENDLFDELFSSNKNEIVLITNGKKEVINGKFVKKTPPQKNLNPQNLDYSEQKLIL